jgi:hypothetical protein
MPSTVKNGKDIKKNIVFVRGIIGEAGVTTRLAKPLFPSFWTAAGHRHAGAHNPEIALCLMDPVLGPSLRFDMRAPCQSYRVQVGYTSPRSGRVSF